MCSRGAKLRQSDGAGVRGKVQYRSYSNILVAVATFYGFVAVWFLLGVIIRLIVVGWFSRGCSCPCGLVVFAGCFCPYD